MKHKLMYSPFYDSWHILMWWPNYSGGWRITDQTHNDWQSAYKRLKEMEG